MTASLAQHLAEHVHRRAAAVPLAEPVAVAALPTPALVVDVAALERNLDRMAARLAERGVGLRPHAKMHKCPEIARRQLARGAVGVCAAKLAEAEVLVASGMDRVLLTSPVVAEGAQRRLAALAATTPGGELLSVVDDEATARRLDAAAGDAGVRLGVLVDLDPDMGRTGIARGAPALALVEALQHMAHLEFLGFQQYSGQLQHLDDAAERREAALAARAVGLETARRARDAGAEVRIFTGGGTGSFEYDSEAADSGDGFTDLQCGSYALMDEEYAAIAHGNSDRFEVFETALTVLTTVVSRPRAGFATVDAGIKSLATDTSTPVVVDDVGRALDGVRYFFGGDEHGIVRFRDGVDVPAIGDVLRLRTSHCDPTINLYDWFYAARDGVVRELWPIAGRGCSW